MEVDTVVRMTYWLIRSFLAQTTVEATLRDHFWNLVSNQNDKIKIISFHIKQLKLHFHLSVIEDDILRLLI